MCPRAQNTAEHQGSAYGLLRMPIPRTWVHSYLLDRVHQYAYNAWRPRTSRSLKFLSGGRALLPDPSGMGACLPRLVAETATLLPPSSENSAKAKLDGRMYHPPAREKVHSYD